MICLYSPEFSWYPRSWPVLPQASEGLERQYRPGNGEPRARHEVRRARLQQVGVDREAGPQAVAGRHWLRGGQRHAHPQHSSEHLVYLTPSLHPVMLIHTIPVSISFTLHLRYIPSCSSTPFQWASRLPYTFVTSCHAHPQHSSEHLVYLTPSLHPVMLIHSIPVSISFTLHLRYILSCSSTAFQWASRLPYTFVTSYHAHPQHSSEHLVYLTPSLHPVMLIHSIPVSISFTLHLRYILSCSSTAFQWASRLPYTFVTSVRDHLKAFQYASRLLYIFVTSVRDHLKAFQYASRLLYTFVTSRHAHPQHSSEHLVYLTPSLHPVMLIHSIPVSISFTLHLRYIPSCSSTPFQWASRLPYTFVTSRHAHPQHSSEHLVYLTPSLHPVMLIHSIPVSISFTLHLRYIRSWSFESIPVRISFTLHLRYIRVMLIHSIPVSISFTLHHPFVIIWNIPVRISFTLHLRYIPSCSSTAFQWASRLPYSYIHAQHSSEHLVYLTPSLHPVMLIHSIPVSISFTLHLRYIPSCSSTAFQWASRLPYTFVTSCHAHPQHSSEHLVYLTPSLHPFVIIWKHSSTHLVYFTSSLHPVMLIHSIPVSISFTLHLRYIPSCSSTAFQWASRLPYTFVTSCHAHPQHSSEHLVYLTPSLHPFVIIWKHSSTHLVYFTSSLHPVMLIHSIPVSISFTLHLRYIRSWSFESIPVRISSTLHLRYILSCSSTAFQWASRLPHTFVTSVRDHFEPSTVLAG